MTFFIMPHSAAPVCLCVSLSVSHSLYNNTSQKWQKIHVKKIYLSLMGAEERCLSAGVGIAQVTPEAILCMSVCVCVCG